MKGENKDFSTLIYERPGEGIARITMNREKSRNALNLDLIYELNEAFDTAMQDDQVKVVIVAASGPHFSSGHDLMGDKGKKLGEDFGVTGSWGDFSAAGHQGYYEREREIYFDLTKRWRNLAKPTIAQVQGKCIAGGLMVAWACDIIIASDDALFMDPVLAMGVSGVEYFAHPWELGIRKAKELLFTADSWDAEEAHSLGMVNQVVPREELPEYTLEMARRVARKPAFALKLTKEAVNQAQNLQGFDNALNAAFSLHHICHSHCTQQFGVPIDPNGIAEASKTREKKTGEGK